jgi:hypothetical protein
MRKILDKALEYAKAELTAVSVLVSAWAANVIDTVDANIEPLQAAIAAFVAGVVVAIVPNRDPVSTAERSGGD